MAYQTGVLVSDVSVELVNNLEIPVPGDDEVLIKNVAVAANPKDWKVPIFQAQNGIDYKIVEGNDVAGYIEAVGKNVTEFKKGDKVAAFTIMLTHNRYGAYQQYTISPSHTTFPLGPKTSFESASTLPLAYMTAVIGLFSRLGLPEPLENGHGRPVEKGNQTSVLIYGASSSVGTYAVQLAKQAGLFVIAIAGASSELVTRLGADVVLDYRKYSTPEDLATAINQSNSNGNQKPLKHIFDAITDNFTIKTDVATLAKSGSGGAITTLGFTPSETPNPLPEGVSIVMTQVATAHGKVGDMKSDELLAKKYFRLVGKWIEEGKFQPNVVKLMPDGLKSVKDGLELLKEDKVRGEKLVYRINETPGLSA